MEALVRKAINALKSQSDFCRDVENAINVLVVSVNTEDNPHGTFRCATQLFGSVIDTLCHRVSTFLIVLVSTMYLCANFLLVFSLPMFC